MKERIGKLLGNGLESKLILGTFHSIARRYLARYGHLIGIRKDFGIADSADSLAIIKRIVKRNNFNIDPKITRGRISARKARGGEDVGKVANKSDAKLAEMQEFEMCYQEYEDALKLSNILDYDDLLLKCVELLRNHPSCVSNVEAVLIDEFQDTNLVQFDLMRLFAAERRRITIVGDPDQSIYGFRAAEIKNYKRMLRQYPETVTIALEENYRSSGAILLAALNVIEQDSDRVAKSLMPTHAVGTRPVLRRLTGAYKEAEWIVMEIQRCVGMTGNMLDLGDFAILLRSAALSRLIETALGKAGIAYRMVGGLRFYDRVEVKTLLDYLRVINQPENNDALARIINTPSRRVGESTIKSLLEEADKTKVTLWSLILGTVQGEKAAITKLQKPAEQSLARFVNLILMARKKLSGPASERASTVDIMNYIIEKTNYERWLEETRGDVSKAQWDNVQELITQATDFQDLVSAGYEDESLPEIDGLEQQKDDNHLSKFLANVALASEVKSEEDEGGPKAQVTISTIHAAKGLEWPVVFIPAVYNGSIPHSRAEDTSEERRLLYVAMTRAKALLYMSCPLKNSQSEKTLLCPFLSEKTLDRHLEKRGPTLTAPTVQSISAILRRASPSATEIHKSSSMLRTFEDNFFPVDGEDDDETDLKVEHLVGGINYTMGQQAPKRRRIELGRSTSNLEQISERDWKPSFATTMDRAASFTIASATISSGFVSAGSHMQVLNKESVNCVAVKEKREPARSAAQKPLGKRAKALEGQGDLMNFFGKTSGKSERVSQAAPQREAPSQQDKLPSTTPTGGHFSRKQPSTINSLGYAIAPSLSNHRVGPSTTSTRPRPLTPAESSKRNNYLFLSSSPPRKEPAPPEEPPPLVPALARKPTMSLLRPPSMHTTTTMLLTQSKGRTLGVRRGNQSVQMKPFISHKGK